MRPIIEAIPAGSAMDLGSQVGYFTFQLALRGHLAIGIENDKAALRAARLARTAAGIERAVFDDTKITRANARELPNVDITIFLSLWHHLCRAEGFEAARELLTIILEKTGKVCIFETGQSNETYKRWSKELPDMSEDPKTWIEHLLIECGATKVEYLGAHPTFLGPVPRHLFAAFRS